MRRIEKSKWNWLRKRVSDIVGDEEKVKRILGCVKWVVENGVVES